MMVYRYLCETVQTAVQILVTDAELGASSRRLEILHELVHRGL